MKRRFLGKNCTENYGKVFNKANSSNFFDFETIFKLNVVQKWKYNENFVQKLYKYNENKVLMIIEIKYFWLVLEK